VDIATDMTCSVGVIMRWVLAALVVKMMVSVVAGQGILYPTESESRAVHSLDGIWNFRLANESDSDVGHREGWYKQELRKVSILFYYSSSLSHFLFACMCECVHVRACTECAGYFFSLFLSFSIFPSFFSLSVFLFVLYFIFSSFFFASFKSLKM
jgi:hypothetical protein